MKKILRKYFVPLFCLVAVAFVTVLLFCHKTTTATSNDVGQVAAVNTEQPSENFSKTSTPESGVVVFDKGASFSMAPVTKSPPVFISEADVLAMQKKSKTAQFRK